MTILLIAIIATINIKAGIIAVPEKLTAAVAAPVSVPVNEPVAKTPTAATSKAGKKMTKGKLYWSLFKYRLHKVFGGKKSGDKSKVAAALFAFFLGGFGVHDFYLGNKRNGFIKLGGTLVGIALIIIGIAGAATTVSGLSALPALALIGYFLILGISIWAFVDFIRILTGSYEPVDGSYRD
ncbi:MAG: TM2 domain-containing protein [Chitinophagaceae bacterium]|nr:TM2 domain-containing protein [Chitinophagaceae bacterium]